MVEGTRAVGSPRDTNGLIWIFGMLLCEIPLLEFVFAAPDGWAEFHQHWLEFMIFGLVSPLLLIAVAFGASKLGARRDAFRDVLAVFVACWILRFLTGGGHGDALGFLIFECLLLAVLGAFRGLSRSDSIALSALSLVGWIVVQRLGAEYDALPALATRPLTLAQVLFAVFTTVAIVVAARPRPLLRSAHWAPRAAFVVFGIAAFIIAFRVEDYFFPYNWGYFLGPAQEIRQGGWLLWDVPTQYGFLNVFVIAMLPFKLTWDSMRVLICTLMAVSTIIAFALFFVRRYSILNFVFSALVAIAFFEFELGSAGNDSFFTYPASGPLRFFWVYPLLSILSALYLTSSARVKERLVRCGYALWIIGFCWSAESAIYSTWTWLPGVALMRFFDARDSARKSTAVAVLASLRALLVAAAMLAVLAFMLSIAFLIKFHALPEFGQFIEFGTLYAGGIVAAAADHYGNFWLIVVDLAAVAALAALCYRAGALRALPLLAGTWGAVWATGSYFLSRSVNSNINALLSLAGLTVAIVLLVTDRETLPPPARIVRLTFVPLLAWGLILGYSPIPAFQSMRLPFFPGYHTSYAATQAPADADLQRVFAATGLNADSPIYYASDWSRTPLFVMNDGVLIDPKPWVPLASWNLVAQLTPERREIYVRRFLQSVRRPGWILIFSKTDVTCADYVAEAVTAQSVRSGMWEFLNCRVPVEYTPNYARPRPIEDSGKTLFGSFDEVYFNDTPTFATTDAPITLTIGTVMDVRGWLVHNDRAPFIQRLAVAVDGTIVATAHYGDPRPDIAALLQTQRHAAYPLGTGFHASVPTRGLTAGLHKLQFVSIDAGGHRTPVGDPVPFGTF